MKRGGAVVGAVAHSVHTMPTAREAVSRKTERIYAKDVTMVGATGIEPVTPPV